MGLISHHTIDSFAQVSSRLLASPEILKRGGLSAAKLMEALKASPSRLRESVRSELAHLPMLPASQDKITEYICAPLPFFPLIIYRASQCGIGDAGLARIQDIAREIQVLTREALQDVVNTKNPNDDPSFSEAFAIKRPRATTHAISAEIASYMFSAHEGLIRQFCQLRIDFEQNVPTQALPNHEFRKARVQFLSDHGHAGTPLHQLKTILSKAIQDRFGYAKRSQVDQAADAILEHWFIYADRIYASPQPNEQPNPDLVDFTTSLVVFFSQMLDTALAINAHSQLSRDAQAEAVLQQMEHSNRYIDQLLRHITPENLPEETVVDAYWDGVSATGAQFHHRDIWVEWDFPNIPGTNQKLMIHDQYIGDIPITFPYRSSEHNGFGLGFLIAVTPSVTPQSAGVLGYAIIAKDGALAELERKGFALLAAQTESREVVEAYEQAEAIYPWFFHLSNHDHVHTIEPPAANNPYAEWDVRGKEALFRYRIQQLHTWAMEHAPEVLEEIAQGLGRSAWLQSALSDAPFLQKVVNTLPMRRLLSMHLVHPITVWHDWLDSTYFAARGLRLTNPHDDNPRGGLFKHREHAMFDIDAREILAIVYRALQMHGELGWEADKGWESPNLNMEKIQEVQQGLASHLHFIVARRAVMLSEAESAPQKEQSTEAHNAERVAGYAAFEVVRRAMLSIPPEVIRPVIEAFDATHTTSASFRILDHARGRTYFQTRLLDAFDQMCEGFRAKIHTMSQMRVVKGGEVVGFQSPLDYIHQYELARMALSSKQAINWFTGLRFEPAVQSPAIHPYGTLDKLERIARETGDRALLGNVRQAIRHFLPVLQELDAVLLCDNPALFSMSAEDAQASFAQMRGVISAVFARADASRLAEHPFYLTESYTLQRLGALARCASYALGKNITSHLNAGAAPASEQSWPTRLYPEWQHASTTISPAHASLNSSFANDLVDQKIAGAISRMQKTGVLYVVDRVEHMLLGLGNPPIRYKINATLIGLSACNTPKDMQEDKIGFMATDEQGNLSLTRVRLSSLLAEDDRHILLYFAGAGTDPSLTQTMLHNYQEFIASHGLEGQARVVLFHATEGSRQHNFQHALEHNYAMGRLQQKGHSDWREVLTIMNSSRYLAGEFMDALALKLTQGELDVLDTAGGILSRFTALTWSFGDNVWTQAMMEISQRLMAQYGLNEDHVQHIFNHGQNLSFAGGHPADIAAGPLPPRHLQAGIHDQASRMLGMPPRRAMQPHMLKHARNLQDGEYATVIFSDREQLHITAELPWHEAGADNNFGHEVAFMWRYRAPVMDAVLLSRITHQETEHFPPAKHRFDLSRANGQSDNPTVYQRS